MALTDFGAVPASSTLPIFFTSHDAATGANEAASNLAVGDILIYKDTSMTQRSSTSGFALIDTDGLDIDGLTGVNGVSIDLSDNTDAGFYAVGSFYNVVLGPITIDTQTMYVHLATFRIVAAESVTGKPKVDVDAFGGTAGTFASGRPEVNASHIAGSAVSTSSAQIGVNVVNAGGTAWGSGAITAASIATDAITNAKIAADAIGAAEIADGAIDAATFAAGAINAAAIAADAIGASELAADAASEIGTAVWAVAARTLTAATNITSTGGTTVPQTGDSYARLGAPAGASVSADVAAVKTDTGNILTKLLKYVQLMVRKDSAIATDNATELTAINANGGSGAGSFDNTTDSEQAIRDNMTTPPTAAAIADQVWEEAIADHSGTTGSTAEALNSAGSAGDPWTTALPGAYGAGSAGKIIGDNINATISSRASQASVDTIDDYIDTEVAAIKAKTDQLTFTTAGQVDAATMSVANNALTAAAAAADLGTEIATAVWASATRTLSALGFTLGASDLAADTITAAKIATDAIGSDELATSAVTEIVNAVLTTAMTESYNADGAAPTLAQALFMTMQRLTEFAISGTTVTVKKLDGSTTAYTLTLDDATDPTSTTRAT